jgi:hydroxyacylglutathione hydrolase
MIALVHPSAGVTSVIVVAGISAILGILPSCATSHDVISLSDGVTVHTFRREYTNAHVVSVGDRFFMVDAGLEAHAPALAEDLRRAGFDPAQLRAIVLTHGHADHAGGAAWFHRQFGTRVIAGQADVPLLAAGANDHLCPTSDRARDRVASDQAARFTPVVPDLTVVDERALEELVGIRGTVASLPGHTPGSLIVTLPGAVIVGDLFRGAIVGSSAELHLRARCPSTSSSGRVCALSTARARRASLGSSIGFWRRPTAFRPAR